MNYILIYCIFVVLILVIYFFCLICLFRKEKLVPKEPSFRIVQLFNNGGDYKNVLQYIQLQLGGTIDIYNLNSLRFKIKYEDINSHHSKRGIKELENNIKNKRYNLPNFNDDKNQNIGYKPNGEIYNNSGTVNNGSLDKSPLTKENGVTLSNSPTSAFSNLDQKKSQPNITNTKADQRSNIYNKLQEGFGQESSFGSSYEDFDIQHQTLSDQRHKKDRKKGQGLTNTNQKPANLFLDTKATDDFTRRFTDTESNVLKFKTELNRDENISSENKNSTSKPFKPFFIIYNNYYNHVNSLPYLSSNTYSLGEEEMFLGGYKSCVSPLGDCVFLNTYSKGVNDEPIDWFSKISPHVLSRTIETTFLEQFYEVKKINEDKQMSYLIITKYLYNNQPAIHVNYINKKKGLVNNTLFQTFIGFINYINSYLNIHKIKYFTIAGCSQIVSARWQAYVKNVFQNNVFISPGIKDGFITTNDPVEGVSTPDFIIVSKSLAPYGVYFYVTELTYDYNPSKYLLVAEILKFKNQDLKTKNDKTKDIYAKVMNRARTDVSMLIDKVTGNEVFLNRFNTEQVNVYIPLKKTLSEGQHLTTLLQNTQNR